MQKRAIVARGEKYFARTKATIGKSSQNDAPHCFAFMEVTGDGCLVYNIVLRKLGKNAEQLLTLPVNSTNRYVEGQVIPPIYFALPKNAAELGFVDETFVSSVLATGINRVISRDRSGSIYFGKDRAERFFLYKDGARWLLSKTKVLPGSEMLSDRSASSSSTHSVSWECSCS